MCCHVVTDDIYLLTVRMKSAAQLAAERLQEKQRIKAEFVADRQRKAARQGPK